MTQQEVFINHLYDIGLTDEEVASQVAEADSKGMFAPRQPTQPDNIETPTASQVIAPRLSASIAGKKGILKGSLAGALDAITLPGGYAAATFSSDPAQSMANREKPSGSVAKDIVQSPSTGAALATAPFTGGASLAGIVGGSVAGAAATQAEHVVKDETTNLGEFGLETAAGIAGGAALGGLMFGIKKGGKLLMKPAAQTLIRDLGRTQKDLENGVTLDLIKKHGLDKPLPEASKMLTDKLSSSGSSLGNLIKEAEASGATANVSGTINDYIQEFGKKLTTTGEGISQVQGLFVGGHASPALVSRIEAMVNGLSSTPARMSITKAVTLKRELQQMVNWSNDIGDQKLLSKLAADLQGRIDEAVANGMGPRREWYLALNKRYSELVSMKDMVENAVNAATIKSEQGAPLTISANKYTIFGKAANAVSGPIEKTLAFTGGAIDATATALPTVASTAGVIAGQTSFKGLRGRLAGPKIGPSP